jgi:hypothetical protein
MRWKPRARGPRVRIANTMQWTPRTDLLPVILSVDGMRSSAMSRPLRKSWLALWCRHYGQRYGQNDPCSWAGIMPDACALRNVGPWHRLRLTGSSGVDLPTPPFRFATVRTGLPNFCRMLMVFGGCALCLIVRHNPGPDSSTAERARAIFLMQSHQDGNASNP